MVIPSQINNFNKNNMDKIFKIYKIDFPSGKVYIGQTVNTRRRWREHIRDAALGSTLKVHCAIRKYKTTLSCFSIIQDNIRTQKEANQLEIFYISKYDSFKNGYNSTPGGENGGQIFGENHPQAKLSDEQVLEIRQIRYSKQFTLKEVYEFYKEDMSYSGFQKIWNYETRLNIGLELDSPELHKFYRSFTKTSGENHGNSKLSDEEVINLRNKYFIEGISMNSLYVDYKDKYSLSGFRKIISGASYSHIPIPKQSNKCKKKERLNRDQVLMIREKYNSGIKIKDIIHTWFPEYSESAIYLIATKQRYKNY